MAQRKSGASKTPNRTDGPALAGHTAWLARATLALMDQMGPALEDDEAKAVAEYVRGMAENLVKITQIATEVEARVSKSDEEYDVAKLHTAAVHARNVADQVKMFSSTLYRKGVKERPAEEEESE